MRRKSTIIGTCSLAAVIATVAIVSGLTSGSGNKAVEGNAPVVEQQEAEVQTPAVSGVTNISSVGVSANGGTTSSGSSGSTTSLNVGFMDAVAKYNEYVYNNDVTSDEVSEFIEAMDIAIGAVPEGSVLAGYTNLGVSNVTSYLNVRKGAGTSYKIIGKMPGNSACEILEEKDGWYKIKSGDVTGYVSADYILTGYEANVKAMETMTKMLMVNCNKLNVREEPSTDCDVATKVSRGEYLEILEEESNGWYKASINNLEGYVSAEYVDVVYTLPTAQAIVEVTVSSGGSSARPNYSLDASASAEAKALIEYAYQFLGNPYKYGGNSLTRGIDCSGFVKQIFAKFGYSLPRTSSQYLSGVGKTVSVSEMKPGDIIVYRYTNGGGHVAIYIGNGKIIHAANERSGICIGNYDFVTPRRVVRVLP